MEISENNNSINIKTVILLFLLSILLIIPIFYFKFIYITAFILGTSCLIYLLPNTELNTKLLLLFIFTGTLFSVNVGFTLKSSQLFAFIAVLGLILNFFINENKNISIKTYFPFIAFIITILPSFATYSWVDDYLETAIRLFFNLLTVLVIFFVITVNINSENKIHNALKLCLYSYLFILSFGFLQQIGYYSGFYDPVNYLGFHSLYVDFYGPFLRISPGTFANEFGQITQSVAITLTTFLIFMKDDLSNKTKFTLKTLLITTLFALLINFTRISFIVYIFYLICIFFVAKFSIWTRFKVITIFSVFFTGLIYLLINTDILLLITVIDRFNELVNLTGSASVRLEDWRDALELFYRNPIFGHGWGTGITIHNVPLELLVETGIIGFIGFYSLILYLFFKFKNMIKLANNSFLKATSISILFTFLGCLIFDMTNHGIYHFILWLTIGLGISTEKVIKVNVNNSSVQEIIS